MKHIPTNEIIMPERHADVLGYTFIWNNHFLRGIFPDSEELARSYFSSGFIDEIVRLGLFPKTWISDYQNEQFAFIIEHEFITPIIYANEWNFAMLKDAALMVIQIASIARQYNYNMYDCHKLNVLFKNNQPMYVDLGSFIPMTKDSPGWHPYMGFLSSYYYILKMWSDGANMLAKRMMAPAVSLEQVDYLVYHRHIYRICPRLRSLRMSLEKALCYLSSVPNEKIQNYITSTNHGRLISKSVSILKRLVVLFHLSPSMHLCRLEKRIKRLNLRDNNNVEKCLIPNDVISNALSQAGDFHSVTFVDIPSPSSIAEIIAENDIDGTIISIQQDNKLSDYEYTIYKNNNLNLFSVSFKLTKGEVLTRDKFPEKRLLSDLVVVASAGIKENNNYFSALNYLSYITSCIRFSSRKNLCLIQLKSDDKFETLLKERFNITILYPIGQERVILIKENEP